MASCEVVPDLRRAAGKIVNQEPRRVAIMARQDGDGGSDPASNLPEVRAVSSLAEFRECIQQQTPCVYKQGPLFSFQALFNEAWLRKHAGQSAVSFRTSPTGKFVDPSDGLLKIASSLSSRRIPLSEFLDQQEPRTMLSGTDTYVFTKGAVVEEWSALWEHAKDVVHENGHEHALIPEAMLSTIGFWMSRDGIQSMTHYDDSLANNLNFQIKGRKEILMFPPDDWKHLKTFKAMSMQPFSFFDDIKQGRLGTAQQQRCQPLRVELNEGDVLFIPSTWFHFVEHVDRLNINLTFWFKTGLSTNEIEKPKQSLRNILIPFKLATAYLLAALKS